MKRIDTKKHLRFPTSAETIGFIQEMIFLSAKIASLGGSNYILDGCVKTGTSWSSGTVIVNGEIIPFQGGQELPNVLIQENKKGVQVYDEFYSDIYIDRVLIFGAGTGSVAWSTFSRLPSISDIQENKLEKTLFTTHAADDDIHVSSQEKTKWNGSSVPVGSIEIWAGDAGNVPSNWKVCDGSTLPILDYPALYAVVGSKYGTVTSLTFPLPNLKKRFVVGYDSSNDEYSPVGKTGGEEKHALIEDENAPHFHEIPLDDSSDTVSGKFMEVTIQDDASTKTFKTTSSGKGTAHENRPPYMAMLYIIKAK